MYKPTCFNLNGDCDGNYFSYISSIKGTLDNKKQKTFLFLPFLKASDVNSDLYWHIKKNPSNTLAFRITTQRLIARVLIGLHAGFPCIRYSDSERVRGDILEPDN